MWETWGLLPGPQAAQRVTRPASSITASWSATLEGTRTLPPGHPSSATALDADRFLFELHFFREHYIEGLRGLRFGPRETMELDRFFRSLAEEAAAPPKVLCHRDFHSRNLMVQTGRLRLVDFQDARLGPVPYDLASLLRDSYIVLPEKTREGLFEAFLEGNRDLVPDPARFFTGPHR